LRRRRRAARDGTDLRAFCARRGREGRLRARRARPRQVDGAGDRPLHRREGPTGWVAAVLQLLAGVDEDDVIADYMLTRERSVDFVAAIRSFIDTEMPDQLEAVNVLIDVEESNLRRSLDAMSREFGDVRRYLVEGTGMEENVVDDLRARLRGE